MRLPTVDEYRQPFIEPLGYLTLFVARVDLLMTDCIALALAGGDPEAPASSYESAAARVRRWPNANPLKGLESIARLPPQIQLPFGDCLARFSDLRDRRNRFVHDAVEIGWDEDTGASTLKIGFPKVSGHPLYVAEPVTPDDIAALACEFGELRADLDHLRYVLFNHWHPEP